MQFSRYVSYNVWVAVVTGGGSGIGTMFASAYVQNGAKVYIASRKEKQLKEVAEALNKKGPGSCHYVVEIGRAHV